MHIGHKRREQGCHLAHNPAEECGLLTDCCYLCGTPNHRRSHQRGSDVQYQRVAFFLLRANVVFFLLRTTVWPSWDPCQVALSGRSHLPSSELGNPAGHVAFLCKPSRIGHLQGADEAV
jgi:hypothetical protein